MQAMNVNDVLENDNCLTLQSPLVRVVLVNLI